VTERVQHTIRQIVIASGAVSTLAGTPGVSGSMNGTGAAAQFHGPQGIVYDGAGALYIADSDNYQIRELVISSKTTIAGDGTSAHADNIIGTSAKLTYPTGITLLAGTLYVTDNSDDTIRAVGTGSPNGVTTVVGTSGTKRLQGQRASCRSPG